MALNGVYAVFRVEAVMNAAGVSRESTGQRQSDTRKTGRKRDELFSQILNSAINDNGETPERTTVYGRDGRMSEARYRRREYHY